MADGNGLVTVLNDPSIRITALDIDYVNNRAYFVDAVTNRIYCVSLKGGNKIFVSMISSTTSVQTCGEVNIRVDPTLEKIYLSSIGTTVNGVPGKLKLWSLNTSGQNWTTLMETVTEPGISISLDILQGKKLFYCLYKPSSKTSVLNCINMYGVESPLMSLSNKIENIVVGMP